MNVFRKDFKMLSTTMNNYPLIYFDNAATTLKPECVVNSVVNYYNCCSVNVHRGDYSLSNDISNQYENVRSKVANFINASTNEVIFSSGASLSLNMVALGYGRYFLKKDDVILTCEAEHASSILPWFNVAKETEAIIEYLKMDNSGRIDLEASKSLFNHRLKVVVIAQSSNVLGYINPIKEICKLAHSVGAIVVVDAAQSIAHLPVDVRDLDVDFLCFSAHKIFGPTGVGVLYGKEKLLDKMKPLLYGGGSNSRFDMCGNVALKKAPAKFESGTPNIEGVLGFGSALDYINYVGFSKIMEIEHELKEYLLSQLLPLKHIKIYNPDCDSPVVVFNVDGIFAQDVAHYLSQYGICVRAGNHCAKMLLDLLGTNETCRLSLSFYNTKEEIDFFIEIIKDITLEKTVMMYV